MPKTVSPEVYRRHGRQVWECTNRVQRFVPGEPNRGLTDKEIASRLGLSLQEVIEIRSIAEHDFIPLEAYLEAEKTKESRFKRIPKKGAP
jgi:DNA-directed RNA polymerase specialized sigma subunit